MSSSAVSTRLSDSALFSSLTDLALNLRWSFNHSPDRLSEQIAQNFVADLHREKTNAEEGTIVGAAEPATE